MKNYRTLALRELFAQKMTSLLILTAIILSTMMTAAVGQSAGVLAAMRRPVRHLCTTHRGAGPVPGAGPPTILRGPVRPLG